MRVALVLACVACSSPPRPAAPDAATPTGDGSDAAVANAVFVQVNSDVNYGPLANAPVVFADAHGVVTAETRSDATGAAVGMMMPGGSVTAVFDRTRISTITNVQPGDHLTFGAGMLVRATDVDVTFTAYPGPTSQYMVQTPCSGFLTTPGTTSLPLEFCAGPINSTDVYVVALRNDVPVATAAARGVDLTAPFTIPNTWVVAAPLQISYANVPGSELYMTFFDQPERYGLSQNIESPQWSTTITVPTASAHPAIQTDLENGSFTSQSWIDSVTPGATAYQLDVGGTAQPWITGVTYDAASRTVSSMVERPFDVDLASYAIAWGDATAPTQWTVYAPSLAPFTLPVLPSDLEDPGVLAPLAAAAVLFDTSTLTGWDAVRPRVFDLASDVRQAPAFGHVHQQFFQHDYN